MRTSTLLLTATSFLLPVASYAATPAVIAPNDVVSGILSACVAKSNGATRIVPSAANCTSAEIFVEWNVAGIAGPAGPKGATGAEGLPGLRGAPGIPGVPGLTGAAGPKGVPGIEGPVGPKGATGLTGVAGPKGATGAEGPAGPKGATGLTGAVGPRGVNGLQGPAGPRGAIGLMGAVGPKGATGAEGPAGPKGAIGLTGAAGPKGPIGLPGATGPAGPTGPRGATGAPGATGPAGADGTGAIPANLTALSKNLAQTGAFLGSDLFVYQASCQVGDVVLSVNGYGEGALPADGRFVLISPYEALFSLIGTNFGGDGLHNFALPDLRANAPKGLQYSICVNGIFPSRL